MLNVFEINYGLKSGEFMPKDTRPHTQTMFVVTQRRDIIMLIAHTVMFYLYKSLWQEFQIPDSLGH